MPSTSRPRSSTSSRPAPATGAGGPGHRGGSALAPAVRAGLAASIVSIGAMLAIRSAPSVESLIAGGHLVVTALLYATAGALVARFGVAAWRGGLFAGLVDALVGHPVSFLLSAPPDPSRVTLPEGVEPTAQLLGSLHLWGAVAGAATAVALGAVAGAVGGWLAGRRAAR